MAGDREDSLRHDANRVPGVPPFPPLPKVDDSDLSEPLTNAQWCESVYRSAAGDMGRVPWGHSGPDGLLLKWLGTEAPRLVRPGSRALVVGCGLGDDVVELDHRGYDVIGFDVAPSAVQWAGRRHPSAAQRFLCADLLDPPTRLMGRFELVVEICTLQSLHPESRVIAARNLAKLATTRGIVLAVSCGRRASEIEDDREGPPWPMSARELESLMAGAGLGVVGLVREVPCVDDEDHIRVVGTFVRG